MELRDSRRLPGPNVVCRRPGAVIDVDLGEGDDPDRLADRWRAHARRILSAVGWGGEEACFRGFHNGASLAITAPIDALYAATEVNEWAFEAARGLDGRGDWMPFSLAVAPNPSSSIGCTNDED